MHSNTELYAVQIDFSTDEKGWESLKRFIDDSIYEHKQSLEEQNNFKHKENGREI